MMWINILVMLLTTVMMEGVAWVSHKYLMHGLLWRLHRDHHDKKSKGWFEENDFFFLIFAIPGIALTYLGFHTMATSVVFWVGAGITLYGFLYFSIHDIFIHQRFKWLSKSNHPYFQAIRRAHKVHHKHLGKEDGECFGMLYVPKKYFKQYQKKTD
ncbi:MULTISPECIES: sterol desaturase family protein [Reichenbachiella]|uniref:Beta-carotene 3-hydroxylase n=1 Tax=Reichenbachiella agariperforans TaxID=156994 RepID=A0A1M6K9B9_REIAG|nr:MULTISPECIES: sterol desaturase family protein [Reichenbachiella]MBU2913468.1 sterol desaturase family protein [Reichenbachiella agariperforans]RJE74562.1 beta-carotene hydroxylase [Reichenbachiella sp. MSK19-1]SHJ55522.1 beta-carotene 3-hydroxylase [Reichenbachiella agariperforans]